MPLENITPLQFWLAVLTIVAPQVYNIIKAYYDNKAVEPLNKAQAKATEDKAETDAMDRLFTEYDRQITNLRRVEDEVRELRPLALKNAILERDLMSAKEDKNDWKVYASRLSSQLEEAKLVPLPFRRTPSDGDTEERIAAIRNIRYTVDIPPEEPNKFQSVQPVTGTEQEK